MPPKKSAAKRKADAAAKSSAKTKEAAKNFFASAKKTKKEEDDEVSEESEVEIVTAKEEVKTSPKKESKEIKSEDDVEKKPARAKAKAGRSKKKQKDDDAESADDNEEEKDDSSASKTSAKVKYNKEDFKSPSNGKEWNLKIVSWNINGIRAWIEKDGIEYLKAEDPDIFCCQETKCDKSKIPPKVELHNYHCYWLSGDTQGYSGVGLMTKVKPLKVSFGINEKKFDDEGRVIVAEYNDFILINTYIPNSGRGLVRLKYRTEEWEVAFRKFLSNLEKTKPIVWCGDLNVAHLEIDLKNPKTNAKSAGFTKEERECFTNVLTDGYFDSFRHLYPTKTDAYTYWSYFLNSRAKNVGWRLDYFVMSEKLKSNLVDNVIRSNVLGSDHCPICLFLKF